MPAKTEIDSSIRKFLRENKLARDIVRNAAKSGLDFFKIAGYSDTIRAEERDRYVLFNGTLYDGLPVINEMLTLGIITEISQGRAVRAVPSIYYFPQEKSMANPPAKRKPEFRGRLISLLDELDSTR